MKKTYINPELQVIVMKTTGMLAQSPNGKLDPTKNVGAGDVEANGFDFDEDDEDY